MLIKFRFSIEKTIPNWYVAICIIAFILLLGFGSRALALKVLVFPMLAMFLAKNIKIKFKNILALVLIVLLLLLMNGVLQYARTFGITNILVIDFSELLQFAFGDMLFRFFVQLKKNVFPNVFEKLTLFGGNPVGDFHRCFRRTK